MKNKIIFIAILCCIAVFIGWGYFSYQKKREDSIDKVAAYTFFAADLYAQFETNEATANLKYTGRVIEIIGRVETCRQTKQSTNILLNAASSHGGINCILVPNSTQRLIRPGEQVMVKGTCIGFLSDVDIVDVIIIR